MRRPHHGALCLGNALSCGKVIEQRFGLVANPRHSKERHLFDKMAHKSRIGKLEDKCTLNTCSWKWECRLWVDSDSSGHRYTHIDVAYLEVAYLYLAWLQSVGILFIETHKL